MNVSELKDKKEVVIALLHNTPVWSLGINGKWFKLDPDTYLSNILEPLVVEDQFFEERKAFAEGKAIEIYDAITGRWVKTKLSKWDKTRLYRIKPAEKEKLWFWRFKTHNKDWFISENMHSEKAANELFHNPIKLEALGWEYEE